MTAAATATLRCRECNARPEDRRDQVSPQAIEYLCSRCSMGFGKARQADGAGGAETPPGEPGVTENPATRREIPAPRSGPSIGPKESSSSGTIFRHGRAGKPGRPRVAAEQRRRKARDRNRAYRIRRHQQHQQSNPAA